jgi:hypothetical protein
MVENQDCRLVTKDVALRAVHVAGLGDHLQVGPRVQQRAQRLRTTEWSSASTIEMSPFEPVTGPNYG